MLVASESPLRLLVLVNDSAPDELRRVALAAALVADRELTKLARPPATATAIGSLARYALVRARPRPVETIAMHRTERHSSLSAETAANPLDGRRETLHVRGRSRPNAAVSCGLTG